MPLTCQTRTQNPELHAFLQNTLEQQWRHYRKANKRCRKKFTEKAVHQWRIETRRMLAFLSVLDSLLQEKCLTKAEALFTRQLKRSTRLRDTHVQLIEVERQLDRFPELAAFHVMLARREKRFARRLCRKLNGKTHAELEKTISKAQKRLSRLMNPAQEHAHWQSVLRAVDAAFGRVRRLRAKVRAPHPASIHAVRLAFKKFRYMAEALQPVLPAFSPHLLRQMQDYQTMMGDIQDLEVFLATLDQFNDKKGLSAPHFRECLRQRHAACIARFMHTAGKLGGFWPFRQFVRAARMRPFPPAKR